ncbi:MAG: Flp family type IVb pilin [Acetobacteraceae bacterium]
MGQFLRLLRDCRAITALEYALIAGVIVATLVIGATSFGTALSNKFTSMNVGD